MFLQLKTKKLEKIFSKKVIPFISVLAFDTASRTGWCRITTDPKNINLEYNIIDFKTTDTYLKYNEYITAFMSLIRKDDIIIIEETFYSINPKVFQLLSRLGALAYTVAHLKGVEEKYFISAISARKYLGLKGNVKKDIVQKEFCQKFNIDIKDNDVIDALILAMNKIFKENTLI